MEGEIKLRQPLTQQERELLERKVELLSTCRDEYERLWSQAERLFEENQKLKSELKRDRALHKEQHDEWQLQLGQVKVEAHRQERLWELERAQLQRELVEIRIQQQQGTMAAAPVTIAIENGIQSIPAEPQTHTEKDQGLDNSRLISESTQLATNELEVQESTAETVQELKREVEHLQQLLLECRAENEDLINDGQLILEENTILISNLDRLASTEAHLKSKCKSLSSQLEESQIELERCVTQGKRQYVGTLADTLTRTLQSLHLEPSEDQLGTLQAELKRQAREFQLERERMRLQYDRDQLEKEALRDVAQEAYKNMKDSIRQKKPEVSEQRRRNLLSFLTSRTHSEIMRAASQKSECSSEISTSAMVNAVNSNNAKTKLVDVVPQDKNDEATGSTSDYQTLHSDFTLDELDFHTSVSQRVMELSKSIPRAGLPGKCFQSQARQRVPLHDIGSTLSEEDGEEGDSQVKAGYTMQSGKDTTKHEPETVEKPTEQLNRLQFENADLSLARKSLPPLNKPPTKQPSFEKRRRNSESTSTTSTIADFDFHQLYEDFPENPFTPGRVRKLEKNHSLIVAPRFGRQGQARAA